MPQRPSHPLMNALILGISILAGLLSSLWLFKRRQPARRELLQPRADGRPGWAMITGASSGLGESFAHRLGAMGFDLILVARRANRLATLADELRNRYHVQCEVLPADLNNQADIERVMGRIQVVSPLALLVNNAGFTMGRRFIRGELSRQLEMINVHVVAPVCLTRAALPGMLASRRGAIINVSSVAAFLPMSGSVMYTATKRALSAFSVSLQLELHGSGVHVQALCPGFFTSEFHDSLDPKEHPRRWAPPFMWTSADDVAAYSLSRLGNGQVIIVPTLVYQAIVFFANNPLTLPIVKMVIRLIYR